MPSKEEQTRLFDEWAARYDCTVQEESFPFIGYARLLDEIVRLCASPGATVVDMGTGTGELARLLSNHGCRVWGVDFSPAMLAEARKKTTRVGWVQADLADGWPARLPNEVRYVASSYALHHFPLEKKMELLRLWATHVVPNGAVIVGDIAFATAAERAVARHRWRDAWDEDEFYWTADETLPALAVAGLHGTYSQVSVCAGVFAIERATPCSHTQVRAAHCRTDSCAGHAKA